MGKFLRLVNGAARQFDESASISIYDETLAVVESSPGSEEILGPITAGVSIALPDGRTYSGDELEVYLDGERQNPGFDYTYSSSTEIAFTFEIKPLDVIRFRIDRGI